MLNGTRDVYVIVMLVQCVALPFYLLSFWLKKRHFLLLTILTSILYAFGYLVVGAWSGLILAVMTLLICSVVYILDVFLGFSRMRSVVTKKCLLIFFCMINIGVSVTVGVSMIDGVMILASVLNYYNYLLMNENDDKTKRIFIFSHILIVFYEIVFQLYIFAFMDFLATLSVCGALFNSRQICFKKWLNFKFFRGE